MAMGPTRGGGGGEDPFAEASPISDINVTPLVDVMLVLLIVFMVAAPLMTAGVPVQLPKTAARATAQPERPIVISVDEAGAAWLGEESIAPAALAGRLASLAAEKADRVVLVRADRTVSYGRVMEVMGRVAAAGFARVSLVARADAAPAAR